MSRRDDERVADILDSADEIAAIIEFGRDAWDKDWIRQLAEERLLEIIGEAATSSATISAHGILPFPGATSSACGSCSHIITIGSTRGKSGQSPLPRFPRSRRTSAPTDDRQATAPEHAAAVTAAIIRRRTDLPNRHEAAVSGRRR